MSEIVKCIDISHWQDFPDFEEVAAAGVIAMIHKATEGTGYSDPNRGKNCSAAIRAGIAVATYHWLSPDADAASQMEYYLSVIEPVQGERVVIDYEEEGCQLSDLIEAVKFLKADPRDLQVSIYSGHLLKEQISGEKNEYLADNTDLWLAQYTTGTPTWPDETYPEWTLWQYSESGNIDGIYGSEVDLNRFNGSDAALLKWINPAGGEIIPMPPEPEPDAKWVDVEITTAEGVAVNVTVNDEKVQGKRMRLRRGPDRDRRTP